MVRRLDHQAEDDHLGIRQDVKDKSVSLYVQITPVVRSIYSTIQLNSSMLG